jgi:catechol 2,3-dioxygenase-like lactoylglutathione lyase family enzyme
MPLSHIEHFLLQTSDMEKTREWYTTVLGMRVGPSPDFKFPVFWLYIGDKDVVHVCEGGRGVSENRRKYVGQQSEATEGTGVVDHIAFRATGLRDMLGHLKKLEVDFKQRQVDDQGLYQLFMFDPNGVKIELNYPASEAKGVKAELRASDLRPARRTKKEISGKDVEGQFWGAIKDGNDLDDFELYLQQFPDGLYIHLARRKLAQLKKKPG